MLEDFDQPWAVVDPFTWIDVEANLLIICASLSTIRKFFYHVAPRLNSENNTTDYSTNPKSDLVTFGRGSDRGTGRNKKKYSKFDDDLYGLDTFNGVDIEAGRPEDNKSHRQRDSRRKDDANNDGDADSAKAILQTRTATVVVERIAGHGSETRHVARAVSGTQSTPDNRL
jgi:hypothetical protein